MSRAKVFFYRASRAAERFVPIDVLWLLFWPVSAVLAARHARMVSGRVPVSALPAPPNAAQPSGWSRWRYLTRFQEHWWLLGLLDRLSERRWQRRLLVEGVDHLRQALAAGPVVVVTLHTTSVVTLAAWIRSLGITTAAVPADQTWFTSAARQRKVDLAASVGAAVFQRGSAHEVLGYLQPGRCIVITLDHEARRAIAAHTPVASLRVATQGLRLARASGATIVPALITTSGRWRYQATFLPPLPRSLVDSTDLRGAADCVTVRLLPLAMAVPGQAMGTLVEALSLPAPVGDAS